MSVVEILRGFSLRYGPAAGEEGLILFVKEVLGVTEIDAWQEKVLRAIARAEPGISVRACHGPGKTAVAAWAIIHRLVCFCPQHCVGTAPSKGQLSGGLMKEVSWWWGRLPQDVQDLFEKQKMRIELKTSPAESWFEIRTSRAENPEALQGIHCEGGTVLIVVDEASGVPEPVFEAAQGSMSGAFCTTLLLSNPTRSSGYFFDTHHRAKSVWYTMKVGKADSARVTDTFERRIIAQYGRDSSAYNVRVLGEFPRSDDDTIIPFEMVTGAQTRDIEIPPRLPCVWGLDVARYGDDKTVLATRNNLYGGVLAIWEKKELMETVGVVKAHWDKTPESERPTTIFIDSIGYGAGVADRLRELDLPAVDINVGESAMDTDKYRDLRTELWFAGRDWLAGRNTKLQAPDPDMDPREDPAEILGSELCGPRYKHLSNGVKQAEPKDSMKKRKLPSPNAADAFLLTFGEGAAIAGNASGSKSSWDKPLKRGLAVV